MKKITLYCSVCAVTLFQYFNSYSQANVLTQHNDLARTGWNNQETLLNTGNVNTSSFGLLFTKPVDDQPYSQPLVVSGVNIPGVGTRNVVYVTTVNNSVYAFDADDGAVAAYWQRNFNPAGFRPPHNYEMHPSLCGGGYSDFSNNIGIAGTPVIDKASNTIYFVTKVANNAPGVVDNHTWNGDEYSYTTNGFFQYLHAVDLSTGAEKFGGPMQITASAPGTGDGNVGGTITFDPRRQFNRGGLVLSRGIVYIPYAAHCDWNPSHGWVLGYDAATLQQKMVYITTPNDGRGGIWMSGAAPAVDANGNLYFTTGNAYDDGGTHYNDLPSVTANRGESVIKLAPNAPDNTATALNVSSYFTPFNYQQLNDFDLDFPIQTLLIPNTNLLLTGLKDNNLYILDRNSLGGFNAASNNVLQTINVGANAQMHSSFAYFGGATNQYVYQFSENTLLQSYKVNGTSLGAGVSSSISGPTGLSGGYMSVTSNGTDPSSAILWIAHAVNGCNANQQTCAGILRAVRADDVNTELWNSTMNPGDNMGSFGKMACPSIANGKVYVTSFSNQISVFGLTNNNNCSNPNVAIPANNSLATYSASSTAGGNNASNAFDNNTGTAWTATNGDGDDGFITVNLGATYTICQVILHWGTNFGKAFNIQGSNDGTNFTTISTITGNTSADNSITLSNLNFQYLRMQGVTRQNAGSGYSINEMEVHGQLTNPCAPPSALNATNITENTATLNWQAIPDANSYTIQYKTSLVSSWITKTTNTNSLDISALTCGTGYTFKVQAVCASGNSTESSGTFTTSNCSGTCGTLPTRYFSADIGDIGVAGSSCFNNDIYTIKGSGNHIGGNSDQFQFAFTGLTGDIHLIGQILTQDGSNPSNEAGLMLRDSISDTSPFAFIGTTSGNGIVFQYRSVSGGPTTTITIPGGPAPYWVELVKTGTTYSAFVSPTGAANTWVQVGTAVDLGFGSSSIYAGMAVTSSDNSLLSTATIKNFAELDSPLTVKLLDFSANNFNNQYVALKWATSSEFETKYFEVQRSTNKTDFVSVSQVNAVGNSTTIQNYSANDYQPANGVNYYRLKIVSIDGSVNFSSVVQVNFGAGNTPQIFPNPADTYFTITSGSETIKDVSIFDAAGKNIQRIINNNGLSAITVSSSGMAAGVYIIKITTTTQVYQEKLFKR